ILLNEEHHWNLLSGGRSDGLGPELGRRTEYSLASRAEIGDVVSRHRLPVPRLDGLVDPVHPDRDYLAGHFGEVNLTNLDFLLLHGSSPMLRSEEEMGSFTSYPGRTSTSVAGHYFSLV